MPDHVPSLLSAGLSFQAEAPTHESLMPIRPHKLAIVVHYWSNHSSGEHSMFELDVSQTDRVHDVIVAALEHFSQTQTLPASPDQYLLRFANKRGCPKTDMPKLDMSRIVIDTNFTKFALCEKALDEAQRVDLEPVSTECEPPPKPAKSIFSCCFRSDD